MDIELRGGGLGSSRMHRWAQRVVHLLKVVTVLALRMVHTVELPEHPDKIALTPQQ
jgi:hypothetical protein